MIFGKDQNRTGALFASRSESANAEPLAVASSGDGIESRAPLTSSSRVAFAGLYLFTMMLYIRPNDILPIGSFPLVKIVAIIMLVAYVGSKMTLGQPITIWPLEMKMLALILLLGILFTPIAASPALSIETLTDSFFKVVTIFVLIINLVDTRERLRSIMKLVVVCGTFVALGTIRSYVAGQFVTDAARSLERSAGYGTFFANPNELAMALNLLLPFAVVFGLTSKGIKRAAFFVCAAVLTFAVIISFSRGGFLGLVALGGVLMWKAGRGKRMVTALSGLVLCGAFVVAMPSGYSDRLFTIFRTQNDQTRSAQERRELLERAVEVVLHHPIIGVGVANFGIYSIKDKVAHNAYLEIAAELGILGFIAYMILIFAPLRALKRIERDAYSKRAGPENWSERERESYFLSIGLQAVIAAYMVCSFFQSSEYFWYLYYLVAYTVSLKRIRDNESLAASNEAGAEGGYAVSPTLKTAEGAVWKSA